ncbi:MAG: DUF3592 domain-containing protein [Candidatus Hadarchaeota archaeon]
MNYRPAIVYEYSVDNAIYYGNNIVFQSGEYVFPRSSEALEVVSKYPAGLKVTVYYDSENPRDSVLEAGKVSYGNLMMGFLVFLIGTIFLSLLRGKKAVIHEISADSSSDPRPSWAGLTNLFRLARDFERARGHHCDYRATKETVIHANHTLHQSRTPYGNIDKLKILIVISYMGITRGVQSYCAL